MASPSTPDRSDKVTLKGLAIDGVNLANNGIWLNTGGNLDVFNCSIKNTLTNGIYVGSALSSMTLLVSNVVISNVFSTETSSGIYVYNGTSGLNYAVLDHVTISDSAIGVWLIAQVGPVESIITDSEITSGATGFNLQGTSGSASIEAVFKNDKLAFLQTGFSEKGYSSIYLSQVTETPSDSYGVNPSGASNYIYSDNTNHLAYISFTPLAWSTQ
jgi:hypothetical protein